MLLEILKISSSNLKNLETSQILWKLEEHNFTVDKFLYEIFDNKKIYSIKIWPPSLICLKTSSHLFNSDNVVIFKFRNSKFDLKDNFVNNKKNSNVCRFLNSHALTPRIPTVHICTVLVVVKLLTNHNRPFARFLYLKKIHLHFVYATRCPGILGVKVTLATTGNSV